MNTRKLLPTVGLALALIAGCTTTRTVVVQSTPLHHKAPAASATVTCGALTCGHGKVGQACESEGAPGIIVVVGPAGQLGCDTSGPVYPPSNAITTPPAPLPVSTEANMTGNCVMGYESNTPDSQGNPTGTYANFIPGPITSATVALAPALAYELTLVNTSLNTADVTGFAVVFYTSAGTEAGSDQESAGSTFIVAGQSLTWTELSSKATDGTGTGGTDGSIPAGAATCQIIQWYHP